MLKKWILATCLALSFCVGVESGERLILYKQYAWGTSLEEMEQNPELESAEAFGQPEIKLMKSEPEMFGGIEWLQLFVFRNDILASVTLLGGNTGDREERAFGAVASNNFLPIFIASNGEFLNCIPELAKSPTAYEAAVSNFLAGAGDEQTIEFYDATTMNALVQKAPKNASVVEIYRLLPEDARMVNISIDEEHVVIAFSYPQLVVKEMQKDLQEVF